ncbi:squalene synthetase-like protein [Mitosporidium daphniae]
MAPSSSEMKRQRRKNPRSVQKDNKNAVDISSIDADFHFLNSFAYSSNSDNEADHPFFDKEAIKDYISNVYGIDVDSQPNCDDSTSADDFLASCVEHMSLQQIFASGPIFGQDSEEHDPGGFPIEYESPYSSDESDEIDRFLQYDMPGFEKSGTIFDPSALSQLRPRKSGNSKSANCNRSIGLKISQINKIKDDILCSWLARNSREFEFPSSFDNAAREKLHKIAHHLQCKSKSHGPKSARTLVFMKTEKTPLNYASIPKRTALAISSLFSDIIQLQRDSLFGGAVDFDKKKRGAKKTPGPFETQASKARLRPGQIVGESAPPISESNVGNVLLRKLGWSPGSSIGKNTSNLSSSKVEDIYDQAIKVTFRKKNSGLGS